jgi:hypothetical protein
VGQDCLKAFHKRDDTKLYEPYKARKLSEMMWLAAWVTFSCVVIPICASVRARHEEARLVPHPSMEWDLQSLQVLPAVVNPLKGNPVTLRHRAFNLRPGFPKSFL